MKHYQIRQGVRAPAPALLFEVRIDLQDVRSGYRSSDFAYFRAEWIEEPDLIWTPDMVRRLSPDVLEEIPEPGFLLWPEHGDRKMIQFLTQNYHPRVWRNSALNLYSTANEEREEFLQRCREELLAEREQEIRKLREISSHRVLSQEQRALAEVEEADWDQTWKARRLVQIRTAFSAIRDDLSRHFIRDDFQLLAREDVNWEPDADPVLQARLEDLRDDIIARYNAITRECLERASDVHRYEVGLNHSQVEIISRSVLWG